MNSIAGLRVQITRFTTLGMRRNTMLAAMQALIGAAALFISYRLIISFHGLEQIGLWSVLMAITNIIRLFDPSGANVLSRHVAQANAQKNGRRIAEYIDSLVLFISAAYIFLGLIAYLPLRLLFPTIFESANLLQALGLLPWMLLSLFANVVGLSLAGAIDGLQRADLRGVVMISTHGLFLLLAVALIPSFGLLGLIWAQTVQFFALGIAARALLIRKIPEISWIPRYFRRQRLKEILSYGVKVQMTGWAGFLGDPLTRLLLNRYGGLEPAAIYEIASKVVVQVRAVIAAGTIPLIPMFAAGESAGREPQVEQIRQANTLLIKLVALSALVIGVSSPAVAYIMLGQPTRLFVIFTSLLVLGWSVNMISMVIYLYGHGLGLLRWNIIGNASVAVGTLASAFWFTNNFGYTAIIGGFAAGLVLSGLIIIVGNARIVGAPVSRLFPIGTMLRWWLPAMVVAMVAIQATMLLV